MALVILMVAPPNRLIVKDNDELVRKFSGAKKCVLHAESLKGEPIHLRSEIVTCVMYVSPEDVEKARIEQEEREKLEAAEREKKIIEARLRIPGRRTN